LPRFRVCRLHSGRWLTSGLQTNGLNGLKPCISLLPAILVRDGLMLAPHARSRARQRHWDAIRERLLALDRRQDVLQIGAGLSW
jgi:hypothetical protein